MADINTPNTPPISTQNIGGGSPASTSNTVDGSYNGQRIGLLKNPTAMLEDAAEELSFSHSEKVEKKLAKRKMGKTALKTFAMKQAELYLKQVPDLERNKKLKDFADQIAQMNKSATAQQLRAAAKQFSKDTTHQFLALSYTIEQLKEEGGDAALLSSLNRAITDLNDESGPEIRAGLNVSQAAAEAAQKGLGEIQDLRDSYRDAVLNFTSVSQVYKKITEEHGTEKLTASVEFLLKGLSTEVNKDTRSLPKQQLKAIMDDIYQLKLLSGMYYQCDDLMSRLKHNYPATPIQDGQALLQELLHLKENNWHSEQQIQQVSDRLKISLPEAKIYFLNGLKDLIRLIPIKSFDNDNQRAELLDSVQQALDIAIDEEVLEEA